MTRILDLTGASPDLVRHVAGPARPRSPLRRRLVQAARARLDACALVRRGGLEETVEWYRASRDWWEPIKSGEYRRYYDAQYAARLA